MKIVVLLFGIILGLYLLGGVALFLFQRNFIYFPPAHIMTPEGAGVPEISEQAITTPLGKYTFWQACPQPGKALVAVFHGNASSRSDMAPLYRDLIDQGYGVVGVTYPGYPGGAGRISQDNLSRQAAVQITAAMSLCGQPKLALYGTSLGAAVASHVAAEMEVDLIILDAPFDSLTNRAQASLPIYPAGLLLRDKWDNIAALEKIDAPLIWIHGSADNVIPLKYGQALFDSYDGPKAAHIIENGQHNDLWFRGGREITLKALEDLK